MIMQKCKSDKRYFRPDKGGIQVVEEKKTLSQS